MMVVQNVDMNHILVTLGLSGSAAPNGSQEFPDYAQYEVEHKELLSSNKIVGVVNDFLGPNGCINF